MDADGSYPLSIQCVLDESRIKPCYAKRTAVSFKRVRSGRHSFDITATDAVGNEASFQRKFRVPYLQPPKRQK